MNIIAYLRLVLSSIFISELQISCVHALEMTPTPHIQIYMYAYARKHKHVVI